LPEIKKILIQYASKTDTVLKELLDITETSVPLTLLKAMNYTLQSGGKRLRPVLCLMTAEMINGDLDSALKAGAAIELIHTYSLIHDDLPCMDNDDFRRGRPTNHTIFGTGIATLAGDALLTYAFNILSKLNLSHSIIVKIIELVSEAAGFNGMVGGQVMDLEAEGREITLDELLEIHRAKTGALFRSAILTGAYCGNPNKIEIKALEEFSIYFGLIFQIIDDILDVTGNEKKLGKKTGSDQALKKATYPRLLGLNKSKKEAEKYAKLAKKALKPFDLRARLFNDLIDYLLIRES